MMRIVPSLLAHAIFAAIPAVADAQTSDPLQSRVEALERELAALKSEIRARAETDKKVATAPAAPAAPTVAAVSTAATTPAAASTPVAANSDVKVSTSSGIKVETADGNFSAALGGRLFVDQAFYDEDKTRMGDGAEVRAARLEIGGTLYKEWIYKIQADFGAGVGSGSAILKDAYFGYQGLAPFELVAGNLLEPISLDSLTSGKYLTFMEVALPTQATVPDRRLGVQATARGAKWTATAGLFSSSVDTTASDPGGEGDSGWDIGGRVTYAPLLNDTQVVHLGFAVNDHNPNSETLRYRARPESHVTGARFIDTGAAGISNANSAVIYQPEVALVFGAFHAEAEYQWLNVDRGRGSPTLNFHGWYGQAGWLLTGEVRPYLIKDTPESATFGRVRPRNNLGQGGFGAFEIAARYSGLDLSDGDVRGGTERNITLGLNWYVNPYVRFMFNYIRVNNDNEALGNVANLIPPNVNGSNDDPRIYQLRGQVDF